jgi:hypothetical protein
MGLLVPMAALAMTEPRRAWVGAAVVLASLAALVLYHRVSNEVSWFALIPLGLWLAQASPKLATRAGTAFVALNVALGLALQIFVRPSMAAPFFSQPKAITEALRWLDANTQPETVVVTNGWLGDYLVRGYTHNLTLSVPGWWTPVRAAERQDRYLVRSAIYAMPPSRFEAMLENQVGAVASFKSQVNHDWTGGQDLDILVEQQAEILYSEAAYEKLSLLPLGRLLSRYRVDYIWVGPWEREAGERDFDGLPEVELVYQNELVQIYAVRP